MGNPVHTGAQEPQRHLPAEEPVALGMNGGGNAVTSTPSGAAEKAAVAYFPALSLVQVLAETASLFGRNAQVAASTVRAQQELTRQAGGLEQQSYENQAEQAGLKAMQYLIQAVTSGVSAAGAVGGLAHWGWQIFSDAGAASRLNALDEAAKEGASVRGGGAEGVVPESIQEALQFESGQQLAGSDQQMRTIREELVPAAQRFLEARSSLSQTRQQLLWQTLPQSLQGVIEGTSGAVLQAKGAQLDRELGNIKAAETQIDTAASLLSGSTRVQQNTLQTLESAVDAMTTRQAQATQAQSYVA